jgi:hypothetical protein
MLCDGQAFTLEKLKGAPDSHARYAVMCHQCGFGRHLGSGLKTSSLNCPTEVIGDLLEHGAV